MNRPVILLTLISFIAMGTGFVREVVSAFYFGTTAAADAFAVTLFYIEAVTIVTLNGLAGYMLVPVVTQLVAEERSAEGFRLMETILLWLAVLSLPVLSVGLAHPQVLAQVMAPDFSVTQHRLLSELLGLGVPAMLLVMPSGIISGVLRARTDYYSVMYGRALFSLVIAVVLFLAAGTLGIEAGAIGLVLGASAQLALQVVALWRQGWRPARPRWWHPMLPQALAAGLPGLLTLSLTNVLMESGVRIIASGLPEGSLAAVNYAQRTLSLISGLTVSLWTVSYTELSIQFSKQGLGPEMLGILQEKIRAGIFMLVPASFLLFAVSEPSIALLFQRGQYDASSLHTTVTCLRWYTFVVVPAVLVALLQGACPAFRRPWRAVIISSAQAVATLGAAKLLLVHLGAAALPAAYTAGMTVACLVSLIALWDLLGAGFVFRVGKYLAQTTVLGVLAFVPALFVSRLVGRHAPSGWTVVAAIRTISGTSLAFGAVFVSLGALIRDPQLLALAQAGRRFYGRHQDRKTQWTSR